jgi:hypothetical protein
MAVSDLLGKLEALNNSNLVEVYVPSQSATVKFKQLSVKQQKDLIKTGLDGALAGATINNAFNEIIETNALDVCTFNVFDKAPIITALRVHAFGGDYTEGEVKVDMSKLDDRQLVINTPTTGAVVYQNAVSIKLEVPSLKKDTLINNAIIAKLKNNQNIEVGDAVGSLYVHEIVKFISSVTVGSDVVDFATSSTKDCMQVVESLPAKLLTEIVEFIQKFRDQETEFLTIDGTTVALDARMFAR